jgi:hypothetical protein
MPIIMTGNLLENISTKQIILVIVGITAFKFLFSKQYLHALISVLAFFVVQQLFYIYEEGFTPDSTKEFLDLQSTINPNTNFDMDAIGRQATQEEMDYYLKHKMWPWSDELKEVYTSAIISNPYVRLEPGLAVDRARVIYNENIMWQILSWQTKEGQFLMNGVIVKDPSANPVSGFGDFPYTSELVKERHDVIKCADDKGKLVLMRTRNVGLDQNGAYITKQYPVDLGTLDKVIPGFSFSTFEKSGAKSDLPFGSTFPKGGCNPCVALNDPPEYSCPFKLDIINVQPGISDVWAQLWGVKA